MKRLDLSRRLVAGALLCSSALACAPTGAEAPAREPVVGLPCEGCEAVFDGLPEALSWAAQLAPDDEPGERMVLEGTVRDAAGQPAPRVIIYAYQTDARGVYPRGGSARSAAARRHGRLRAWARTDEGGRYRFETIRPAGYPDSPVAQHIHMHVLEPGCCTYYIDSVHFTDDPRLREDERRRLTVGRGGSGLVRPDRDEDGVWRARRDIRLGERVPGHPGASGGQPPAPSEISFEPTALESLRASDDFLVTEPEWSRDGQRVVFAGGVWPDLDVYVLDADSGRAEAVFGGSSTEYMPSW